MENKQYVIIPDFFEYEALVVQTTKKDILFLKDEIAKDLSKLNINGKILFDRLITTGNTKDRFSYDTFVMGTFDRDKELIVVLEPNLKEKYENALKGFYDGIRNRVKREYGIDV